MARRLTKKLQSYLNRPARPMQTFIRLSEEELAAIRMACPSGRPLASFAREVLMRVVRNGSLSEGHPQIEQFPLSRSLARIAETLERIESAMGYKEEEVARATKAQAVPRGAGKDRFVMEDAASQKETDRGRVYRAERANPKRAGVGTARKSYERKHGEKMP